MAELLIDWEKESEKEIVYLMEIRMEEEDKYINRQPAKIEVKYERTDKNSFNTLPF